MKKGGAALAGPIWNKFMNEALKVLPDEKFEQPDTNYDPRIIKPVLRGSWQGNESFFIDKISGKLATASTPKEALQEKVITNVHSILYWIDKNNITGNPPSRPENDPEFNHFEITVQNWWMQNKNKYPQITNSDIPSLTDDVHTEKNKPIVTILEPKQGTSYNSGGKITISISSNGPYPINKTEVFLNDNYLGYFEGLNTFTLTPDMLNNQKGEFKLTLISHDTIFNSSENSVTFKVE
jgi:hypothetical protein